MKKITFTLLFLALATVMYAQDFHFGVTAGPNLSTVKLNMKSGDVDQPKSVIGFHIGAFAEWSLTDKISLRPELSYQTVGYRYPPEEELYGYRHKSNYISLPVMVRYSISEKLKVGLGPYVSAKLVAKYKYIPSSEEDKENAEEGWFDYTDVDNDEFNPVDYGLCAGVGYQVLPKLGVALGYNYGLSNIFNTEGTDGSKAHNRYFRLGLSYTIR
ncbi:porin family protein [Parapedobacter pyrenivorans]|uniref:porin family protein n=1 Tax=Parapedobacter pyrenivorans TaxID=1305674 RepID=UPI00333FF7C6